MKPTQEHGSAISALLDGYGRRLYAYLRVLLRDDDAATEAFNDTAAAAFDGAGRPAQPGQLAEWLFYLAHEQARRHRPALRPEDDQATMRASARRSRSRTKQNLADADQARLALLQLAPAEREVLVLGLYGLRPADVARIVGIRPEAATAAAARARSRYVKALGPTRQASKADELLALALTFAQESLPHDRIVLAAPTVPASTRPTGTQPTGTQPTRTQPTRTQPTRTQPTTPPTSPVSWSTSGPPGPAGSPSPVS